MAEPVADSAQPAGNTSNKQQSHQVQQTRQESSVTITTGSENNDTSMDRTISTKTGQNHDTITAAGTGTRMTDIPLGEKQQQPGSSVTTTSTTTAVDENVPVDDGLDGPSLPKLRFWLLCLG